MYSVNCPICGQRVAEVDKDTNLKTRCHRCKTNFVTTVKGNYVTYEVIKESKDSGSSQCVT